MSGAAKRLFDDLLNIEVNTLVKPGMTGRKMPAIGHALLDIFSEYDIWLCAYGGKLNEKWIRFRTTGDARAFVAELRKDPAQLARWRVVENGHLIQRLEISPLFAEAKAISFSDFDELRERARTALDMHRVLLDGNVEVTSGADIMLRRIMRNCDQLKGILEAHSITGAAGPVAELSTRTGEDAAGATLKRTEPTGIDKAIDTGFSGDEVMTIRKAWELGTETIIMQTVVQLDGDVVTRINEASTSVQHQMLRDLHRENVANALAHWNSLVGTFVTIATKLLGYLTG